MSKARYSTFHVLKVSEGGPGQNEALRRLKEAGIPAEKSQSELVGHTAVAIRTANRRTVRRVENILFR